MRELKEARQKKGQNLAIAVAGCVAQAEGVEIFRRESAVDIVVGPQSYHRLPDMLSKVGMQKRILDTEFPIDDKFSHLEKAPSDKIQMRGVSAFVTIQEGCDKFCTFCVVPYTRGMEVSRTVESVMEEITHLMSHGVREITLLGQNVNAYHGLDKSGHAISLSQLIKQIAQLEDIKRIRYMTSHPLDMSDDLIGLHGSEQKLMPFIHLPVQSGSDRILALMNRRHSADDYRNIIKKIRGVNNKIVFSSDFIVGFPDESDEEFDETLKLIKDIDFASAYSFSYSARPGTPATNMKNQLSEDIKTRRLHMLQALLEDQRQAFNASMIGQKISVLFEKKGRHNNQIVGKSIYMQPVHVEGGTDLIGQEHIVLITHKSTNSLFGNLQP
jgi:tRNA-2-methylthio-N6-dimethylallyladenosine synthase